MELQVGLLGLGTVGAQVAERMLGRREAIAERTGVDLRLRRVLVRDLARPRGIPTELLTGRPEDILDDPSIQVVVELIGGEEPARDYLERAIRAGKHVVTANKVVMAKHGPDLLELAGARDVEVYFEAAVGGGIPLISTFKVDLIANDIEQIAAVLNGTTNYVLGRMAGAGIGFQEAVAEAQSAGFAEADPSSDVDGFDAAYKLSILASIAFGARVHPDDVYREGIREVDPLDFRYARELGYEIKLLAYAARPGGRIEVRVHPAMVPSHHPLATVEGANNAVQITGDLVGEVLLWGQGAGGRPTASAVVGDLLDLAHSVRKGAFNRVAMRFDPNPALLPMAEVRSRAYLRLRALDEPGVLAAVGSIFAEEGVSIASMIQKDSVEEGTAELVFTTHPALEAGLQAARARIAGLDQVKTVGAFYRVI
ncbi:MAG TPA: homoserine dehydrogenase [Candidatus Dormibacteraeota bacterium]|nr:homoserine dehydrogenase [Candidatus Dormibacteraeota bacterium]